MLALTTLLASMDLFVMPRRPTRHNPHCARGPCRALPLGGTCAGEAVLARHFPAGAGNPLQIIGRAEVAEQLQTAVSATPGALLH